MSTHKYIIENQYLLSLFCFEACRMAKRVHSVKKLAKKSHYQHTKNVMFWRGFENFKLAIKLCYHTGHLK